VKPGKRGRNGDANKALRRRLARPDARGRIFEVGDMQSRGVEVAACFRQCDGARGAVNELGAKFVFKRGNLFADRGLTNSKFLRDAEKLPLSTTRTNIRIASSLSTKASRIPLRNGLE
jgi:hypothetical protein